MVEENNTDLLMPLTESISVKSENSGISISLSSSSEGIGKLNARVYKILDRLQGVKIKKKSPKYIS